MSDRQTERVIALAGLLQATSLVRELARHGKADEAALRTCLYSVFTPDADDTESVYGSLAGLRYGLEELRHIYSRQRTAELVESGRYAAQLFRLERRLKKHPHIVAAIGDGIRHMHHHADPSATLRTPNIYAKLAELYQGTVSQVPPRILVSGEPMYLNNPDIAARIRAMLMAALRSAVLLRQLGGGRLWLLLQQRRIQVMAKELLKSL